jgi:hypothetical protein
MDDMGMMADAAVAWVEIIHRTCQGWQPRPGSLAKADLENTETGRRGVPWGRLPVETAHTIVSGTALMMVDHVHALG